MQIIKFLFLLLIFFQPLSVISEELSGEIDTKKKSLRFIEELDSLKDYKGLVSIYRENKAQNSKTIKTTNEFISAQIFAKALEQESDYLTALAIRKRMVVYLAKTTGPKSVESGEALNLTARTYEYLGNFQKAITLHKHALAIYEKKIGSDHLTTATILNNLAGVYSHLNQFNKALPLHLRSLEIREKMLGPNHVRTANALDALATTYIELGELKKALSLSQRSLNIRELNDNLDDSSLAVTLNNLALIQKELGLYEEAIPSQTRALELTEKLYGAEHEATARCLLNLASSRSTLGQYHVALDLQQRALEIYEKVLDDDDFFIGITLTHLASTNLSLKRYEIALSLQKQGLAILEKKLGPNHQRVASALNNLGSAYWALNEYENALPILKRNLTIKRKTLGYHHISTALAAKNLANIYLKLNRHEEGFKLVTEALAIYESILGSDHPTTAETYTHLADYAGSSNSEYSIYLLKQHVNSVQATRKRLHSMGQSEVNSYTERYKNSYQKLALMLVDLGRLSEAQQVLEMLKEDEYFEFIRRSDQYINSKNSVNYSLTEQKWMARYLEISNKLASLGAEKREIEKKTSSVVNRKQLNKEKKLNYDLIVARKAFVKFLSELRTEFSKSGLKKSTQIDETNFASTKSLQTLIRNLGDKTALLQFYITEEKIGILLTTSGIQIARSSKINRRQLSVLISSFVSRLRDPKMDTLSQSQEMYRLLIGPVESDLEQAGIDTLMFSLDGALRYVPISALHDGKNYSINRWNMVLYNPVVKNKLLDKSSINWTAAGLGRTRSAEGFSELPSVESEIRNIVKTSTIGIDSKGIMPGEIYIDDSFTADRLKEVSQKSFQLMHIASHFRFSPGTEVNSFLLLGDGTHLSLGEIRTQGYRFDNLELLTLSACETGLGGGHDADGKEIDGLGVLAQKQGAKAVISTLWAVADESTSKFMTDLYSLRKEKTLNKAEALRQSQLNMLLHPKYSHPFYWAPYVLMGNWK
jgi:CHAT domain-containing protein